jgi:hypothetical protein
MWTLRQTDTGWEVVDSAGVVVHTAAGEHAGYSQCLTWLADQAVTVSPPGNQPIDTTATDGAPQGCLAERWQAGPAGICANAATDDGRDFTNCTWSWRASTAPLPLMLLTETTYGHFEAQLAGFIDQQGDPTAGGVVQGWFHDTDVGQRARDIIQAQGAFGCSVDPGLVDAAFVCVREVVDEDGWPWCEEGSYVFAAYEISGVTLVPFPAFASAAIELVPAADQTVEVVPVGDNAPGDLFVGGGADVPAGTVAPTEAERAEQLARLNATRDHARPIVAAAPLRPPASWLNMAELPDDDARYVAQPDGQIGVPLTIHDDGQVYGHAGLWGTCHIGRLGECVTPPRSEMSYAHFHLGVVTADDGVDYPTGVLTAGCDHALATMRVPAARDHYAHNGIGWADVRASDGRHGPWVAGVLRPDVTPEQVRVLRAGGLSGDWRGIGGHLEMISVLAVNVPGFPIVREALVASGFETIADAHLAVQIEGGRQTALVAAGLVHRPVDDIESLVAAGTVARCENCGRRSGTPGSHLAHEPSRAVLSELRAVKGMLATILSRTEPLRDQQAQAERERLLAKLGS